MTRLRKHREIQSKRMADHRFKVIVRKLTGVSSARFYKKSFFQVEWTVVFRWIVEQTLQGMGTSKGQVSSIVASEFGCSVSMLLIRDILIQKYLTHLLHIPSLWLHKERWWTLSTREHLSLLNNITYRSIVYRCQWWLIIEAQNLPHSFPSIGTSSGERQVSYS